ncbi:MAG TPA: T9SS type A sorting domain-containing protein [Flavobacteriales bacterium]|nr:T9SS type A sorting domain-containing protein [Flavobacteriales bacterium]HRO39507.1 T9SS type A sorting domain-containing protein [Flavobacteriales bacterium]HRP81909.1 T9SS type A sorting domain-containing protein [Flavobacteriales bacterium]HRQ83959.1 T9SS type A sorting domain-containing protein [Flavobacteriales bacterium]
MRTWILSAAMAATLPLVAMPGNDGPFITDHWTNGQYAQAELGPVGVFPNPANSQVNIVYPGLTGEATVSILAEDGRMMRSFEVGDVQDARSVVRIDDLRNGLYLVRVIQPSGLDLTRMLVVANN